MIQSRFGRISLAICILLLAGCGGRSGSRVGYDNTKGIVCSDLRNLPQNLSAYTSKAGGSRALLSAAEQEKHAAKTVQHFFGPWRNSKPSANSRHALWGYYSMRPDGAYTDNGQPFPQGVWDSLKANCNAAAYPSLAVPAITVRNSSLRSMPTLQPYYKNPRTPGEGYPFDYFQHTALWVGTPIFLTHRSADGEWFVAEARIATGWISASDVALVDESFMQKWRHLPLATIVKDNVSLHDGEQLAGVSRGTASGVTAHIGTLLPYSGGNTVLYPTRTATGTAGIGKTSLQKTEIQPFPLPLTPERLAAVGNEMMNQPYGWGGISENRDCSAMTRDLFLPFGIWLPRNSSQQGAWGTPLVLTGMSLDAKEQKVISEAKPFFSLVWLPGHIGLYLGEYKGKPVMFHNMWGLRVKETNQGVAREGRAVVGKAVVTGLRPGAELRNISTPGSLLDRIERVSILPEADNKMPVIKNPKGKSSRSGTISAGIRKQQPSGKKKAKRPDRR